MLMRAQSEEAWADFVGAPDAAGFNQAWLQLLMDRLAGAQRAMLLLPDAQGVFRPAAWWPRESDLADLADIAQRTVAARELVLQPQPERQRCLVGFPIELRELLAATLILDLLPLGEAQRALLLREVHWASAWLHLAGAPSTTDEAGAPAAASRKVLEALRCLHGQPDRFSACLALANHLARQHADARVFVGMHRKHRTELVAISDTAWFERRSAEVREVENGLEEAVDQRRSTVWPSPAGEGAALNTALGHALGPQRAGVVVVLAGAEAFGAGALLVERPATLPFSADERLQLEQIAKWAGPVLELAAESERWLAGRPARLWRAFVARWRDPRRPVLRWGVGLGAAALAALTLVPVPHRISADAAIEGRRELAVTAPFEGYIGRALVKAGATVKAGTVLAVMDNRDLLVESGRREAAAQQQERKLVDAMSKRDRSGAGMARAALDEAEAHLALVRYRLARAEIRAEVDGNVIAGDLSQQIGAPVKQGQVLFRLAPQGEHRAVLKVDEHDVRRVQAGQEGVLLLAGATEQRLRFRLGPVGAAEAGEGANRFRVEAELLDAPALLRPGMEGVAKVEVGRLPLLLAWTLPALQWVRLAWFRLWP